jgi:hypothetical protein
MTGYMEKLMTRSESRREFFRRGLRNILLTGILYMCGVLGWRKITAGENDDLCEILTPCKECTKNSGCTKPEAIAFQKSIASNQMR